MGRRKIRRDDCKVEDKCFRCKKPAIAYYNRKAYCEECIKKG